MAWASGGEAQQRSTEETRWADPVASIVADDLEPDEGGNGADSGSGDFYGIFPRRFEASAPEPKPATVAKGIASLAVTTALLSLFSFGFAAFYFQCVLRWPSAAWEPPAGYGSWTSCHTNATRPALTALGHALPFNEARALVSVPKLFVIALSFILYSGLATRWQPQATLVSGTVVCLIAFSAAPIFVFADRVGIRAMPKMADGAVSVSMLVLWTSTYALFGIRRRRSSRGIVARYPKFFFAAGMTLMFLTTSVLSIALAVSAEGAGANPGIVVSATILLGRVVGFVARWIFRHIDLDSMACFPILFAYEVTLTLAVRRYWLALPSLREVGLVAGISAALELSCNAVALVHALRTYNFLVKGRQTAFAHVQISVAVIGITCNLMAEHVALHGGLGCSLFLDPRILTIDTQPDTMRALESWALAFIVECVVDVVFVVPVFLSSPVSPDALVRKQFRSWTQSALLICACVHAHLAGLHSYLEADRYFCD